MIDFSHNFAHAMTAELSWPVQICGGNGVYVLIFENKNVVKSDLDDEIIIL